MDTFLVVNCDQQPQIHSGLFLSGMGTKHLEMGQIRFEKREDKLYANGIEIVRCLSPDQERGHYIKLSDLRTELKGKKVLNACVMDALIANPWLIPSDWKNGGNTLFFGSIFRNSCNRQYIARMYWCGDNEWKRDYIWIEFHPDGQAVYITD